MIVEIVEHRDIEAYLVSRQILTQYLKTKKLLLAGDTKSIDFKIRQPKSKGYYQFRINQKYRAFGYFQTKERFVIFEISDHQDF